QQHRDIIEKALEMEKEKLKTLEDVAERTGYFITEDISWDVELTKKFKTDQTSRILNALKSNLERLEPFEKENIEDMIRKFCQENNLKTGEVFHPLRFALTGTTKGPGLFELIELLGKQRAVKRIGGFLTYITR
ncbi:MAG TPA: hypothetical protein PL060_04850, partial [bacterium]|nr:hypothetical protein [bacterium]